MAASRDLSSWPFVQPQKEITTHLKLEEFLNSECYSQFEVKKKFDFSFVKFSQKSLGFFIKNIESSCRKKGV
jgi:hypothetical protein